MCHVDVHDVRVRLLVLFVLRRLIGICDLKPASHLREAGFFY